MIDYHVHTVWSGDSTESVMRMCRAAVDRGLTEICFTEHADFEPTDGSYGAFDYEKCLSDINAARAVFAGRLVVRFGVEVDYQERYRSGIEEFLDGKEFDYVIGSAHYVNGVILEDHHRYFPGKTQDEAYNPYLENVLAVVETGWFDTLAHLDLCKRYGVRYFGPFDWQRYDPQVTAILRAVIDSGMTLEINTSGLRQSPADTYPSMGVLSRYLSLGGRNITVGSDAHSAEDIGKGIAQTIETLRSIGFETVDTFCRRRREAKAILGLMQALTCGKMTPDE